jgi:DNA-binding NtrC family response regulator
VNILIVEDNSSDRELLVYALAEHFKTEARFREASTLKQAQDYLERGGVACILLDLQLPDSAGLDTFLRIYTAYPQIPIVIVTHNANLELAKQLVKTGAEDVILKDFTNTTAIFRRVLLAQERTARNRRRLMAL